MEYINQGNFFVGDFVSATNISNFVLFDFFFQVRMYAEYVGLK